VSCAEARLVDHWDLTELTATFQKERARLGIAEVVSPARRSVTYDSAGRLTQIVDKNASGATVASYSYMYIYTDGTGTHDGGLRQTMTDASGNSTSYGYDSVGRLLSATTTGPNAATYSYAYDLNGNMTSKTVNGVTTTYTVNAANEVTNSGYAFDANGNQRARRASARSHLGRNAYLDIKNLYYVHVPLIVRGAIRIGAGIECVRSVAKYAKYYRASNRKVIRAAIPMYASCIGWAISK